ncbi:nicotinate-nucleotide--dimethylbenzimidazole phosphoribosyltransferase [Streptomyces sp. SYSU K21746]
MTDTGQVPGEGMPENAGMVDQPGISAPGAYTFLDPAESHTEDDDLLLMPSAQGAWSDPQPVPAAVIAAPAPAAQPDAHETGGRDSGSVDLGGVRVPPPVAPPASAPAPARRPLHMGPPLPEATGGVVRSLADRGPAAVRQPGPEYLDVPRGDGAVLPGPQLGEIPPQAGTPWSPQPVSAETVVPLPAPAAEAAPEEPQATRPAPEPAGIPELAATEPEAAALAPAAVPAPDPATGPEAEPSVPEPQPVAGPEAAVALPEAEPVPGPEAVVPAPGAEPSAAEGHPAAGPEAAVPEVEPLPGPEAVAPEAEPVAGPEAAVAVPEAEPFPGPEGVVPSPDEPSAAEGQPVAGPEAAVPVVEPQPVAGPEAAVAVPEAEPVAGPEGVVPAPDEPSAAEGQPVVGPEAAIPVLEAEPVAPEAESVPAREAGVPAPGAEAVAPEAEPVAGQEAAVAVSEPQAVTGPEIAVSVPEGQPDAGPEAAVPVAEPQAATGPEAAVAVPEAEPLARPEAAVPTPDVAAATPAPAPEVVAPAPAPEAATRPAAAAPGYDDAEREAVLRVMRERRDIRNGFRTDPIPHEVLLRVLEAAHTAPSVGHSQPWDFVVIRSAETRRTMHELATRQRETYAKSLPKGRAKQFKELKIEAILDTPVNIVVTADPTRGGRHTLGRHTQPQMAPYSSALAVENLWLAARAEGLGVGWVSFFDEREMVRALGLPEHLEVVAYLCVGYVDEFPEEPELMQAGWSKRRPLAWVVHEETYGRRALPGEEPHDLLQETISNIRPLDAKALGEAWERQKRMTKPAGALGMLEIISAQLSGLSRMCPPPIPEPAAVAIFAGDHGVHAQGVTAWPQEVTSQMVANFLGGGAVCNAFANQVGAEVCVIDVGVAGDLPATPGLLPRKVRPGTSDFTTGPALTREEVLSAIEVGIETARDLVAAGNKALLTGEMGIANTTVSAALISVYTDLDPAEVTGRGTGINDEMHARKVDVVRRALDLHQPDPADPIGVLAAVGGLEHAAIVGLLLGGASLRTPVVLDGVSAGAAALVARAIAPEALAACIAGHRSAEPGHVAALNKLGLRPLIDLDLRLGEGTGALLALPVVQSAARAMHEVATFDSAGVTEK